MYQKPTIRDYGDLAKLTAVLGTEELSAKSDGTKGL